MLTLGVIWVMIWTNGCGEYFKRVEGDRECPHRADYVLWKKVKRILWFFFIDTDYQFWYFSEKCEELKWTIKRK